MASSIPCTRSLSGRFFYKDYMNTIFILLILFQLKHFIADYPLQGKYMLGKFKGGKDWILPLLCHVAVHGLFTFIIVSLYKPNDALLLAMLDMSIHFIMDRIKASPDMLGRYKPLTKEEYIHIQTELPRYIGFTRNNDTIKTREGFYRQLKGNTYFWWALGLDQGVHHLTHYLIIYLIVS